ncbi:MAG: hypothetical protein QM820_60010 [Minicystis sp.]
MDPEGPDPESPPPPPPDDVAGGLRFVHLLEMQTKARVAELGATLNALIEALIAEGALPLEVYEKKKRLAVLRENRRGEAEATVDIADVPDKYAVAGPPIDCAARLPLCKARCCTLDVVLSVQDLDERVVSWDYARPYRIRRREDGFCTHHHEGRCTIHEQRPGACRAYDCRRDRRIWLDFDRGIPAP